MFSISTSLFIVLNTRRLLEEGFNFQSLVSKQKFPNNIFRQAPKELIFATVPGSPIIVHYYCAQPCVII